MGVDMDDNEKLSQPTRASLEYESDDEIAMLLAAKTIKKTRESQAHCKKILVGILTMMVVVVLALALLIVHGRRPRLAWVSCGNTTEQAISAGCHFEPMLRGWVPDACFFHDPIDEYDPFHDREWFIDSNLTEPADMQKVIGGKEDYHVYSKHFHMEHCLYAWRKLAIAVERKLPLLDSKSASAGHSNHCSLQIADNLHSIWNETYTQTLYATGKTWSPTLFLDCVEI